MTDQLRTVRLYGQLGKLFGRTHRLAVSSPAEAVRALCAIRPGFEKHVIESTDSGIAYRVTNSGAVVSATDELHMPTGVRGDIRIAPVVCGAKSGLTGIILGAALIASSFFLPVAPLVAGVASSSLAGIAFGVGVSLALGGVAQMLAPHPKTDTPQERPDNKPSEMFNGPVNTTAQGHPVPICYGRLIVGSAVISAGILVNEVTA